MYYIYDIYYWNGTQAIVSHLTHTTHSLDDCLLAAGSWAHLFFWFSLFSLRCCMFNHKPPSHLSSHKCLKSSGPPLPLSHFLLLLRDWDVKQFVLWKPEWLWESVWMIECRSEKWGCWRKTIGKDERGGTVQEKRMRSATMCKTLQWEKVERKTWLNILYFSNKWNPHAYSGTFFETVPSPTSVKICWLATRAAYHSAAVLW